MKYLKFTQGYNYMEEPYTYVIGGKNTLKQGLNILFDYGVESNITQKTF